MSNSKKGHSVHENTINALIERNKNNNPWKGKNHNEQTKLKMSNSAKGRIFSEETRQKMSVAAKNRKDRSKNSGIEK